MEQGCVCDVHNCIIFQGNTQKRIMKICSYMYDNGISVNYCIMFLLYGQPCQKVPVNKNSFTNNGSLLQCAHFISIFIFNMQANLVLFRQSYFF